MPAGACPICNVSITDDVANTNIEPSEQLTPLAHSERKRSWCQDCQKASPVEYFDLSIREPSLSYLGRLAVQREGRAQFETICKIHDIIKRYPHKSDDAKRYMVMRKCASCDILFSKCVTTINIARHHSHHRRGKSRVERLRENPSLCKRCTAYVVRQATPMRMLESGQTVHYSSSY